MVLLIDVQQRLIAAMAKEVREQVLRNSKIMLSAATALAVPVVVTEQYPKGLGHTLDELAVLLTDNSAVIEKTAFSVTKVEAVMAALQAHDRKQVVLLGMEAHICVLQTALNLVQHGYDVHVVEDAVCARDKANHTNAIQRLRAAGVTVSNTESVLFEWLADAQHPAFKSLSKLIV